MRYVSFLWIKFIFLDLTVFKKKKIKNILGFKIYVVKKAKKFDENCRHSGCFFSKRPQDRFKYLSLLLYHSCHFAACRLYGGIATFFSTRLDCRAKAQSFLLTNSVLQPFTVKRGGDYVLYYATLLPFKTRKQN